VCSDGEFEGEEMNKQVRINKDKKVTKKVLQLFFFLNSRTRQLVAFRRSPLPG
jgi:hypothetical protein